jgi:drug/metabolite transporter (DMT)-like permease
MQEHAGPSDEDGTSASTDSWSDPSAGSAPGRVGALLVLALVALVWGVAFSVVKDTVASMAPASLVTWRFAVAGVVLLLARPRCLSGVRARTVARAAALGCLLGAGFLLHTKGIQSTPVVTSAFITGTAVVFAPVVARLWLGRRLAGRSVIAILLASGGLGVITLRGASFGPGEMLIAAAAALWGVHLVALEQWTRPHEVYSTAVIQVGVVAVLAAIVETVSTGRLAGPVQLSNGVALVGLGALATGAAFLLLTWAQTRVDATTAAVVLTLEPVFGAATAMVLGEHLPLLVGLGAVAVVTAAVLVGQPGGR